MTEGWLHALLAALLALIKEAAGLAGSGG